jgi:large subunit ribosomal protein L25
MNNYLITIFFLMKSITIKGSERSVGKVATKALRWIGSLRIIRRKSGSSFLSRSYGFQKLGLHSNAHTVEIDLGKGKSNAILQDIQVHPVSDKILH